MPKWNQNDVESILESENEKEAKTTLCEFREIEGKIRKTQTELMETLDECLLYDSCIYNELLITQTVIPSLLNVQNSYSAVYCKMFEAFETFTSICHKNSNIFIIGDSNVSRLSLSKFMTAKEYTGSLTKKSD